MKIAFNSFNIAPGGLNLGDTRDRSRRASVRWDKIGEIQSFTVDEGGDSLSDVVELVFATEAGTLSLVTTGEGAASIFGTWQARSDDMFRPRVTMLPLGVETRG